MVEYMSCYGYVTIFAYAINFYKYIYTLNVRNNKIFFLSLKKCYLGNIREYADGAQWSSLPHQRSIRTSVQSGSKEVHFVVK
ncbi:hypothetical protein RIR_jg19379.t1 [Rhizophagus irregularis DAOM 181602=DAOM 197198]|nr:hypothetical protein RIR_jg19379.t1 [Rhizophagus irregularis DAOM 181602=DAOM 197198]